MEPNMKWTGRNVFLALCLLLVPLIFAGCWFFYFGPRNQFENLLTGDEQVEIQSLTIDGQQQKIDLSDASSLTYLTVAFRTAKKEGYIPSHHGFSYTAYLRMGSMGSVYIGLSTPADADGFTVAFPLAGFDDPTYYWVPLPQPMPTPVADVLKKMRKPPSHQGK
jgi:hypothetical protein